MVFITQEIAAGFNCDRYSLLNYLELTIASPYLIKTFHWKTLTPRVHRLRFITRLGNLISGKASYDVIITFYNTMFQKIYG